jgi:hypothetical protein
MKSGQHVRVVWIIGLIVALFVALRWLVAPSPDSVEAIAALPVMGHGAVEPPPPELPMPADVQPIVVPGAEAAVAPAGQGSSASQAAVADTPRAELRVLVVDPRGRPVEGADVASNRGRPRRQPTDVEGLARIEATPGETVGVAARHDDYRFASASATLAPEPGSVTDVRLELGDGLEACLTVQSHDGRAIEGACVRLAEGWGNVDSKECMIGSPEDLQWSDDYGRIRGELHETRATDAQGRCCVPGLRRGPLTLHVDAAGYVPLRSTRFDLDAHGGDLGVVVLEPAVRVGGFVEDAAGPVPDALVEVFALGYSRTTTAADGSFAIDGLSSSSLPGRAPLRASHPERGHFHDNRLMLTVEPVHVVLVPDIDVRLELRDAQTHVPIDGDGVLERRMEGPGLLVAFPSSNKVAVRAGHLDVAALPYDLAELSLKIASYDELVVPMSSITADADGVLELELTRPVHFLVRVRSASTGDPIEDAQLMGRQVFKVVKGGMVSRNFALEAARFDAQAGGYVVAESELHVASGDDISLGVSAKGYASKGLPIAVAGQRTSPLTIDVYLEPGGPRSDPAIRVGK